MWSWNVACGSPSVGASRRAQVRQHLNEGDADVLLLQEARPDLVDEELWQVAAADGTGHAGSCSLVAIRRLSGGLTPLPRPASTPAGRDYCIAVADISIGGISLLAASLYVPFYDSSAEWLTRVAWDPVFADSAGVLGADLNSPVPNSATHPMFDIAEAAGWTWLTMPLLSKGPTMKQSQIDHVLTRQVTALSWTVDAHVLEQKLSDHALLRVEVRV